MLRLSIVLHDGLAAPLGDTVLKVVTARLEASVRLEDTVARLGGDEFVVLIGGLEGSLGDVHHAVLIPPPPCANCFPSP
ncbi:diguanylate cyclase [Xanthomonas sp. A2111]|uniref:Diguanylate cyclase n=1 Tax=Xanthomonas hawaiiensis TaxID=3003247 RepID=A0ABU2IAL9_9XANT|nr:diguanylate cyclase [Xanthomonas sp. A2111]MDS9995190.1 diguanylate cyclase [Xanthomonas sp. A2111]